jgi:hypothetical protein
MLYNGSNSEFYSTNLCLHFILSLNIPFLVNILIIRPNNSIEE